MFFRLPHIVHVDDVCAAGSQRFVPAGTPVEQCGPVWLTPDMLKVG